MARVFFKATEDALNNITEQFNLVHPLRASMLYTRNARLETLKEVAFSREKNGAETLLWVPPSRPYYQTGSVFDQNKDFSKVLVFSSWEMVPA